MPGKPPHFPAYPRDFVSDGKVVAMTTEQVGAYWLLLCQAWFEDPPGSVPADDSVLSRWARLPMKRWAKIKAGVMCAFELKGERYHQKRMATEYQKLAESMDRAKERGKKGADGRWNKHCSSNASRMTPASGSGSASIPVVGGGAGEGVSEAAAELAQEWAWRCTRKTRFGEPADRAEHKAGEFQEALRVGIGFAELKAAILDGSRNRNEYLWEFWKRFKAPADSIDGIREFLERGGKNDAA